MIFLVTGELELSSVTERVRVALRRDRDALEVGGAQPVHVAEGEASLEAAADGLPRRGHRENPGGNFCPVVGWAPPK